MPIHESWQENAVFWDSLVDVTGNQYWQYMQQPALERFVPITPGCKALDLATGNGIVARWLAAGGADVHAADGSSAMIEQAQARGTPAGNEIQFHVLDMTLAEDFDAFIKRQSVRHAICWPLELC